MEELKFLEEQQVSSELIKRIEEFRSQYEVAPEAAGRIVKPSLPFSGKDIRKWLLHDCLKVRICCSQAPKPQEKISLQRIWHTFSTVLRIMFLFM